RYACCCSVLFFYAPAGPEIYTLSLHDALPISVDRLAVRTSVMPFDPVIIREAIMREYYRGGQCFMVCPRLPDLDEMQKTLAELRSEEHTSELQSRENLVCRLLLEKKKNTHPAH